MTRSALLLVTGCESADTRESRQVESQQSVYNAGQPIPRYDWSLSRHLWIKFYDAQNEQVTTFSYIQPITGGAPIFETPSMGFALPRDTQLTNPHQVVANYSGGPVIDQAEPNGLFTSPNTDATIIFAINDDGSVAPIYTEQKVTTFPFPVKWEKNELHPQGHFVRVGATSNIKISPKRSPGETH